MLKISTDFITQQMHYLNIENWNRKEQYQFYKDFDNPFFNVCTEIEVGAFLKFIKAENLSFSFACLFASLKAANETEPLRYRLDGDRVVVYDRIDAGNTILNADESFSFCYFEYNPSFSKFYENAQQVLENHKKNKDKLDSHKGQKDLIHCSTLPWYKFTSFSHARNYGTNDSVPKFVFGKYFEQDSVTKLPFSIEVHHALMDGLHVSHFLERFQAICDDPEHSLGS